jgi:hypothetical protein
MRAAGWRWFVVPALLLLAASGRAEEASADNAVAASPPPAWSFDLSGLQYLLPEGADYLQVSFMADGGRLHLEARHNYEDLETLSFFGGAGFEFAGDAATLRLTPMLGAATGRTDGIVPAVEIDLAVGLLEWYGEAEYLFDIEESAASFFYLWSGLSVSPADWLCIGIATEVTDVRGAAWEVAAGPLAGVAYGRFTGTVHLFSPGGDDHYATVSLGVGF